jgi:hypothetical protein
MEVIDIWKYLPHRYPFLLVDRVLELEENKRIVAIKNVTINEPQFTGHFPNTPVTIWRARIKPSLSAQSCRVINYALKLRLRICVATG